MVGVSVGTAVTGKDVAVLVAVLVGEGTAVSITTGVSVAGGWVGVGGTAVFVITATRVGTAVLSAVETAVAVSPSTPHPISSQTNTKMKENRTVFMALSRNCDYVGFR
ncbi:MAG: hypothetical protein KF770_10925 [Anaerolineae bacterium]|nr:hypothetical protein [Anaerolineae bacterium]